jgi:uncharacterized protein with NRDE domain
MCLILFAYKAHPKYKLVIAANRDEFYARPTLPAHFWSENGNILAGKDLEAGGTWLGISKTRKISLLTNYRDLSNIKANAPSRGHLVSNFLESDTDAKTYLKKIEESGDQYNGFNIISGDWNDLFYYGNYQKGVHEIKPGIHGLSNALLDTEWPKVTKGKRELEAILKGDGFLDETLFELLYDNELAADEKLPETGVGYEKEKMLSPKFIKSPNYGSRCSTVLIVDNNDNATFSERTYSPEDYSFETKTFNL